MTLHDDHRSPFQAPPATEAADGPDAAFDGSDEAMHRLRHPFAVPPADEPRGDNDADESDR
jgi:hypothetical protein